MIKRQSDRRVFIFGYFVVACAIIASSIALIFHAEAKITKTRYEEVREERLQRMQIGLDTLVELKYVLKHTTGIPSPDLLKASHTLDQLISDIEAHYIKINIENTSWKKNGSPQ
ncbi:hypothetical protein [Pseudomonas sp. CLCA07]